MNAHTPPLPAQAVISQPVILERSDEIEALERVFARPIDGALLAALSGSSERRATFEREQGLPSGASELIVCLNDSSITSVVRLLRKAPALTAVGNEAERVSAEAAFRTTVRQKYPNAYALLSRYSDRSVRRPAAERVLTEATDNVTAYVVAPAVVVVPVDAIVIADIDVVVIGPDQW